MNLFSNEAPVKGNISFDFMNVSDNHLHGLY